jgi:ATP-dependent RNA circularization protein (DNA/RNA ligase family)
MSDFFRFPHTPHLAWLGEGTPRDDKVLSRKEAVAWLSSPVRVEEKVDGANLGLSLGPDGRLRAQNRGQYLEHPHGGQFSRLPAWLAMHETALVSALGGGLMLFGEWCAARHSVVYESLPDWFLAFDVYDRALGKFWGADRRDDFCEQLGLRSVPTIFKGEISFHDLVDLVETQHSDFGDAALEGVVLRLDEDGFLKDRAKLVRPSFTQAIVDHWRRRAIVWNRLGTGDSYSERETGPLFGEVGAR